MQSFQCIMHFKNCNSAISYVADTVGRRKRELPVIQICPGSYINVPCDPNEWIFNCKFVLGQTCVYWMKCKEKVKNLKTINDCRFTHSWNSVMCCVPNCA